MAWRGLVETGDSLRTRLLRIRDASERTDKGASSTPESSPPGLSIPGWFKIGNYTWKREETIHGYYPDVFVLPQGDILEREQNGSFVFMDTETTGLSGGAGTIIFLIGFGRIREEEFHLTQYFLSDYPGEQEFLSLIKKEITGQGETMASYNGAAFDLPLLRTRLIMNRETLPEVRHRDLLFMVRRLWQNRISSCSLKTVEPEILGIHRCGDIPGYLVPYKYFDYLKTGRDEELVPVFIHHRQDILSLAHLAAKITGIMEDPFKGHRFNLNRFGRIFLNSDPEGCILALTEKAFKGDIKSAKVLGEHFKKNKDWQRAVLFWKELWQKKSFFYAGVELAKYYEHGIRDYETALLYTNQMRSKLEKSESGPAPGFLPDDLEKRERRLKEKAFRCKNP